MARTNLRSLNWTDLPRLPASGKVAETEKPTKPPEDPASRQPAPEQEGDHHHGPHNADPGIYPTTTDLAGGRDKVLQQPAPEQEGDYRHGPHNAVEQANTEVEQAEVEDPPDPGTYPTTADLAGVRDQVHQQQAPVLQQP